MQKGKYTVKSQVTPLVDIERLHQPTNLKNRSTINDIVLFPWVYNALIWFMSWYNYASLCHYPYVKYKSFGRYTFSASASNFNIHKLSIIPTGGNKKKRELGFANRRGKLSRWQSRDKCLGENKRRREEVSLAWSCPLVSWRPLQHKEDAQQQALRSWWCEMTFFFLSSWIK